MKSFGFQWHVTNRCNARCVHCYQDEFSDAADLPRDDVLLLADRILEALPDSEVSVNLTGGEPLLWPHLLPLLQRLHTHPNFCKAQLITNATVANDNQLRALAEWEKFDLFKVSVESGDEGVNDAIRGKGSLSRTLRHMPLYLRYRPVVWMMTLGKHNAASIPQTVQLARQQGISGIIFERFVPLGQAMAARSLVLDAQAWRTALMAILLEAGIEAEPEDLAGYRAFWLWTQEGHDEPLQGALCNLGDESMALLPDATVFPCRRLPVPVGNALREPFTEILERLSNYRVDALRRQLRGGLCGLCGVADCCGCRALSLAAQGDMLLDDPQCVLAIE
ncbi:MAG: radical SAM protein [Myxococcota bacterium]|jgi:MoaA/NifB/PqqE/SkfB family radical SAM enzyme|nr:radical SAM protein [Myxococcota bacterium]